MRLLHVRAMQRAHTYHGHGVSPNLVGEASIDGSISSNIGCADLLNDCSSNHIIDIFLANGGLINQPLERQALQIDAKLIGVDG